jgi:UDP-N-acetylglucosamine transferase subunit ALG13
MKILVLVGTHSNQFNRLIKAADELGKENEVFIQNGYSSEPISHSKHSDFITHTEILKKMNWADIVITHAGAGTVIDLLSTKKQTILVPRLKKYGEHTNDHQLELAKKIQSVYKCPVVTDINLLKKEILKKQFITKTKNSKLLDKITQLLEEK